MADWFDDPFADLLPDDSGNVGEAATDTEEPEIPVLRKGRSNQEALIEAAKTLQINPRDLAAAISYETGGKFSTSMMGGKGGNYMGLIQFGPNERKAYGASADQSFDEQVTGPVVRYLQGRGLPPGADLATIYRTINGGNPRASLNASDGNGTIAQHIARIQQQHYGNADKFLEGSIIAQAMKANQGARRASPMVVSHTPEEVGAPPSISDTGPLPQYAEDTDPPMYPPEFDLGQIPEEMVAANMPALMSRLDLGNPSAIPGQRLQTGVRSATEGAVANIPNIPLAGAAFLMDAINGPAGVLRGEQLQNPIREQMGKNEATTEALLGLDDPETPGEAKGRAVGREGVLGFGMGPNGVIGTGINALSGLIAGDANAAGKKRETGKKAAKEAEEFRKVQETTQFLQSGQVFNPNSLFVPVDRRAVFDRQRHNIVWDGANDQFSVVKNEQGKFMVLPTPADGSLASAVKQGEAVGWDKVPTFATEDEANKLASEMTRELAPDMARRKTIMDSLGGPRVVDMKSLYIYGGGLIAATVGAIYGPKFVSQWMNGKTPRLFAVDEVAGGLAHPDVGVVSKARDLVATTWLDSNKGLYNIMNRINPNKVVTQAIRDKFEVESGGNAQAMAEAAVKRGIMRTTEHEFQVSVPLSELNATDNPDFAKYMHLQNIRDLFLQMETRAYFNKGRTKVPDSIRGMKFDEVNAAIKDIETTVPDINNLKNQVSVYQENYREAVRFLSTGTGATMSKQQAKELLRDRKHYIPGWDKQLGADVQFGAPSMTLGDWMKTQMRMKLDNEAKLAFVQGNKNVVLPGNKRLFVDVTGDEIKANPKWKENTVEVYERGKKKVYSTDPFIADVLKLDPYYHTGIVRSAEVAKNAFQVGTTGPLAPYFALTSFLRNHNLAKLSATTTNKSVFADKTDFTAPNILQSIAAVPQTIAPQAARAFSESMDRGGQNWIRRTFGDEAHEGLSTWLMHRYQESTFGQLESAGSHYGSIYETSRNVKNKIDTMQVSDFDRSAISKIAGNAWTAWDKGLQAVHNAPSLAYARKNWDKVKSGEITVADMAHESRSIAGNNMASGRRYTADGKAIRMQGGAATQVAGALGGVAEAARVTSPWFNVTMQGQRRLAKAYMENPARFVGRTWLYHAMPAAGAYMYAASLPNDPNGRSYADYMINGRSAWDRAMNMYIPIPGEPAEKGIKIPLPHEFSIVWSLMQDALYHITASNTRPISDDMKHAFGNYAGLMVPATPQLGTIALGLFGMNATPGGAFGFGSEAYAPRKQAYDQYGTGLPPVIETTARAAFGGIADVVTHMLVAGMQADGETAHSIPAALTAGGRRMLEKAPIARDLTGQQAPVTGNNRTMDEYYDYKKSLNNLIRYYRENDKEDVNKKGVITREAGDLRAPQASKSGAAVQAGAGPPVLEGRELPGFGQPEADNPVYMEFIKELSEKFGKDSVNTGGIGFKTASDKLRDATAKLGSLRRVNDGNVQRWLNSLEDKPGTLLDFKRYGVNMNSIADVKTFYGNYQQQSAKHLMEMIKTVEEDMSKRYGQKIDLKTLQPYLSPMEKMRQMMQFIPQTEDLSGPLP